jgi:predicted porin
MKKSLVALAVLAAAGAASAQSSVTLFGIVDATLQIGRGSITDRTQLTHSGYNSSRLGFRGTEDLGGGMSASFWLEAGMENDNGQGQATNINNQVSGTGAAAAFTAGGGNGRQGLTFNRRSTVSLAGGWGEVRLGRDYSPQFWNLTTFDPFGTNGVGTTQTLVGSLGGPTNVRASNSIGYFLPGNLGGFYGQVQLYLGENAEDGGAAEDDGRGVGLRLGYAAGPLNVAFAIARTDFASGAAGATGVGTGEITTVNLGGQWDFGFAKLMAHYNRDTVDFLGGEVDSDGFLVGALVPVGAGEIRVSYSQTELDALAEPRTRKLALGYVHNLSKRTALYTTVARVRNNGGAAVALGGSTTAANTNSTGFDFGLRHSF